MDFRQLRTLVHVAETGSLTRAAERLNTVQPTLSRQIRLLEEELGISLFQRLGYGMKLTEAGERLLSHARIILRDLETARSEVLSLQGAITGNIVCGMIPSLGDRALVPFLRTFAEDHPLVSLRVVTGYAGFVVEWLAQRQLDTALLYDLPELSKYDVTPLAEEPLFVVGPPDAGFNVATPVPLATLAPMPMILPSPQHGLRKLVDTATLQHNFRLNVRIEADSLQAQLELARVGFGWTILPPSAIATELGLQQVSAAPLCEPEILRRIVTVLPVDRRQAHSVRVFADNLAEHVVAMIGTGKWPGSRAIS